jgi:guanosine-3',5'-bis(diphosphate) 3'-pyrophosphohydrolase
MIASNMSTLERAIAIAAEAHAGEFDRAGQPFILHPIRVMIRLAGSEERIVAVLHDVVEDTSITLDYLRDAGFSEVVVNAIEALTKLPGETRLQAAERAAVNPIARSVKLADNADNMDLSRIVSPTEKDYARIREYEQVRALLLSYGAAEPLETFSQMEHQRHADWFER